MWRRFAAVVSIALTSATAGCDSGCGVFEPSAKYRARALEHEIEAELCADGGYYRECGADPGGYPPIDDSDERCTDAIAMVMRECKNASIEPDWQRWGPNAREATLGCVWYIYHTMFAMWLPKTPRCRDGSAWAHYPEKLRARDRLRDATPATEPPGGEPARATDDVVNGR